MNNWRDLKAIWAWALLAFGFVMFVAIAAISRLMPTTPDTDSNAAPTPTDAAPAPDVEPPAPELVDDPVENTPVFEPDSQETPENKGNESVDDPIGEASNYPCECTPTCPCDAEHCQCRGKERCSEVCPCHKKLATFHCPKCDRNGYCDYDPDIPEQSHPHRVCRDCKQWMDRIDPPMSAQEGYDVIVWRRVQAKMQADAKAREQAVKAEAERRKQRSSMPVYDPFDEDMPSWRPRRFYFNSTSLPAAGCKT